MREMKRELDQMRRQLVELPSRFADPGGGAQSVVRNFRVVEIPSDTAIWLYAERVVRGPDYGNVASPDYGRWIGLSEKNGTTIADEREQINIDGGIPAGAYAEFILCWGANDVTTRATPILKAFKIDGAWHLHHPFFGVPVLELDPNAQINDCVIPGVK
ncbi:MAG: hypothetical protein ACPGXK_00265 [Phycisphaerae bacterium]